MKIKSIYIDGLHNAVAKTYEFTDLVYLFGRNGAGKTTVLNAIQLALLGYIPGTAKNSREALLRHSRDGKIVVRLVIEDSNMPITIERKYDAKTSKVTITPDGFDIHPIIAAIELPIFNFNEFVGQTANKLKDYFIKNILPTSDGDLDWEQILKQGLSGVSVEDAPATLAYGLGLLSNLSGSPIEQVAKANAIFKEEQSFVKSELTRLQATVDSLIYYDDYSGPTDLDALTAELLSLGAIRDALIRYQSVESVMAHNRIELTRLHERADELGGVDALPHLTEIEQACQKKFNASRESIAEVERTLSDINLTRTTLTKILNGKGHCPYTNEICGQIDLDDIKNQFDFNTTQYEVRSTELAELKKAHTQITTELNSASCNVSTLHRILSDIESLEKSLANMPEKPNTEMSLQEVDREIQHCTEDRDKLKANQAYEATIENITKLKYKSEINNTALAAWIKLTDINGLQTSLTEKPFEELAAKMTKYIQTMYGNAELSAKFNVSTKANSFSFGLIRDARYISYDQLSSGEKCLYTLALMICITDSSDSPLKLLLCDDMFDHLDSQAVEGTFLALKNIPNIQFILAGVKDCKSAEDIMIKI
jgi:DNA repair exonuclease SbcCD ATPase subunit